MGSCLSSESRSPVPSTPTSPMGSRRKKNSKKRLGVGSRNSSFDYKKEEQEQLQNIPGRMYQNGSSGVASMFSQQGKKGPNQDAMIVWEEFGSRKDTVFCGVFDGHGPYGHLVARRVRDSLPLKLSAHWEVNIKNDDTPTSINSEHTSFISNEDESKALVDAEEDTETVPEFFHTLKDSFLKSFKVMDRELKMYANIDCFCSGTTAVTLIKQGLDLVMGNIGDSRAILGTLDEEDYLIAVQLTVDLKPNLPAEAERIRKSKGRVFALRDEPEVSRVWLPNYDSPGLAMARAFGDFCLKEFGVISVPEISYRRLTDKDKFIVLATDGIWDVLENEEVVHIVASCPTRSDAARVIVQSAVHTWKSKYPTSKVDDCAVVCLFLDSEESDNLSSASSAMITKKEEDMEVVEEEEEEEEEEGEGDEVEEEVEEEEVEVSGQEDSEVKVGERGWSALEGVSRVNTLVNLPVFVPPKGK